MDDAYEHLTQWKNVNPIMSRQSGCYHESMAENWYQLIVIRKTTEPHGGQTIGREAESCFLFWCHYSPSSFICSVNTSLLLFIWLASLSLSFCLFFVRRNIVLDRHIISLLRLCMSIIRNSSRKAFKIIKKWKKTLANIKQFILTYYM